MKTRSWNSSPRICQPSRRWPSEIWDRRANSWTYGPARLTFLLLVTVDDNYNSTQLNQLYHWQWVPESIALNPIDLLTTYSWARDLCGKKQHTENLIAKYSRENTVSQKSRRRDRVLSNSEVSGLNLRLNSPMLCKNWTLLNCFGASILDCLLGFWIFDILLRRSFKAYGLGNF